MANFTPPFDTTAFLPSKSDLTKWIYDIWVYLRDNPIVSEENVETIINTYLEEHPIDAPVKSVNGKTGDVTGLYDAENPPPYPVLSVNNEKGAVLVSRLMNIDGRVNLVTSDNFLGFNFYDNNNFIGSLRFDKKTQNDDFYRITEVNKSDNNGATVYTSADPPPYPVVSVNGKTGNVTGLYDAENPPPYPVVSVNGKTGNVTGLYDAQNPQQITAYIAPGTGWIVKPGLGTYIWGLIAYAVQVTPDDSGWVTIPWLPGVNTIHYVFGAMVQSGYAGTLYNITINHGSNIRAALGWGSSPWPNQNPVNINLLLVAD